MRIYTKHIIGLALFITAMLALAGCNHGNGGKAPAPSPVVYSPSPAPTATPAPSPLDISEYAFEPEKGLYDIYPLCHREGMALVYIGYSDGNTLAMLHISEDGAFGAVGELNLEYGVYSESYRFMPVDYLLPTSSSGYEFISVAPFAFYDAINRVIHVESPDQSADNALAIADEAMLEGLFWADGNVLAYELTHDVLYSIDVLSAVNEIAGNGGTPVGLDTLNSCTELYDVDYRYRYVNIVSVSQDGRYASFYGTDSYTDANVTFVVDTQSGEIIGQTADRTYIETSDTGIYSFNIKLEWLDDLCISALTTKAFDSFTDTKIEAFSHSYENSIILELYMQQHANGYLFSSEDEGYTLHFSDYSGAVMRSVTVDYQRLNRRLGGYAASPQILPRACGQNGEALLPLSLGSGMKAVILWKSDEYAQAPVPVERTAYSGDALEIAPHINADYGELTDYANRVGNAHGVTILIGTDATLYLSSHSVELFEGEENIRKSIEQLDGTLSKYPDGFMDALCSGGYLDGIVIALTGNIYSTTDYGMDFASAVTSPLDSYRIVAFDITNVFSLESTIFHEFSHIIDAKLDAYAPFTEGVVWSAEDWNALNPADFTYYDAYLNSEGYAYIAIAPPTYTPEDEAYRIHKDVESVYFLDRYAKTFATEDRAILFEYVASFGYQADFLQSSHIIAKLQYYFTAIRQLLDPNGALTEPTCWELALERLIAEVNAA